MDLLGLNLHLLQINKIQKPYKHSFFYLTFMLNPKMLQIQAND